jgi:hypothetical protein
MADTRYQRHPDLRITDLDGEGVALHLGERRYFSLNDTGLALLRTLEQPSTLADLVTALCDEYEVSPEEAEATARIFLDQCLANAVVLEQAG